MARNNTKTYITIDANGRPAKGELERLERSVNDLDDAVEDVGDPSKLDGLKAGVGGLVDSLGVAAGPAGAAGVAAALGAAAVSAANAAEESAVVETTLETTAEDASRLIAVFEDVGIEANDLIDIGLSVNDGLQDSEELAARLGVRLGEDLSPAEALKAAIDSWDLLTPTERAQLFGEEGVRQVGKIAASGEELDDLLSGVSELRIYTDEEQQAAIDFNRTVAELKGVVQGLVNQVGGDLVDAFNDVNDVVEKVGGVLGDLIPDTGEAAEETSGLRKAWDEVYAAAEFTINPYKAILNLTGDINEATGGELVGTIGDLGDAYAEAGDKGVQSFDDVESAYDELMNGIDEERALLKLQQSFDDVKQKGVDAFVAANTEADNAEETTRIYELAVLDLQEQVGRYAQEVLNLPEDKVTDLVLNAQNVGNTEAIINAAARTRTVNLLLKATPLSSGSIPRYVAAPSGRSSGGATQNITVNFPRTATMRELDASMNTWRRANGPGVR